jgi:DNA-binding PadR family transcriptional regulator
MHRCYIKSRHAPEPADAGRSDHHHRHHRSSRGSRVFEQGDLRYVMLQLIADKPSHGYELIKEIEDRLGGAYSPSPGTVYPTLTLLEELGYLTVEAGEGAKKAYTITDEGRAALDRNRATVEAIFKKIAEVGQRAGNVTPPQLVRAMENLKLALRLRLERGKLTDQQIADVAAALDAAALTVERE